MTGFFLTRRELDLKSTCEVSYGYKEMCNYAVIFVYTYLWIYLYVIIAVIINAEIGEISV
jgi:hypothetical protein